jgi:hypothetical protein
MMFCLSSNQLLDKTIFRDADDTSGHEAKENLSSSEKFLLKKHKKLHLPEITVKTQTSRPFKPGEANRGLTGPDCGQRPHPRGKQAKLLRNVHPNPTGTLF